MNNTQRRDVGIDTGLNEDQGTVQREEKTLWRSALVFVCLAISTATLLNTFVSSAHHDNIGTIIFGVMTILVLLPSIILTFKNVSSCCPWIIADAVIEVLQFLSLLFIAICHLKHKKFSHSSNVFIKVLLAISAIYILIAWYVMERKNKQQRAIEKHERAIEERRRYKEVLFMASFNSVSLTLADAKDFFEEIMADAEELMADTNDIVEESWTNKEYEQTMAHIDSQLLDLANTVAKLQTLASQMIKLRN